MKGKILWALSLLLCMSLLPALATAPNTSPIYTLTPVNSWSAGITTANTAMDGTGTVSTVFTAGSAGAYIQRLRVKALGSNVATVLRVFINNGSSTSVAANNSLYGELSMTTVTASNSASNPDFEYPMNLIMPAGYTMTCCIGTTVATGVKVTAIGGSY